MLLDLKTTSVIFAIITFSLCVLMMFIWRTNRTYAGFGFWTLANISAAVGFIFLTFQGLLPDLFTVIIAHSFAFGSMLLCFLGNRKFLGLSGSRWFSLSLFVLNTVMLICSVYFVEQVSYRIGFISFLLVIISGRNALDFRRAWLKERNASYAFVSAIYLIFSFLMTARVTAIYLYSVEGFSWIQPLSYIVFIVFAVAWTFIYMILNNERLQDELKTTKSEFEKLATTDFLTGINNNRRFFEIGEIEIQRAKRFHNPLTLIMFDIDFFKKINDTYGHAAGDKVLVAIVDLCKFNLRELDSIGRLGGEEFGILLPHTDIDVGKMVAARLRRAFDEAEINFSGTTIKITASFGVTELSEGDKDLKEILDRADTALYQAKQNGRNQVKASVFANNINLAELPEISSAQIM